MFVWEFWKNRHLRLDTTHNTGCLRKLQKNSLGKNIVSRTRCVEKRHFLGNGLIEALRDHQRSLLVSGYIETYYRSNKKSLRGNRRTQLLWNVFSVQLEKNYPKSETVERQTVKRQLNQKKLEVRSEACNFCSAVTETYGVIISLTSTTAETGQKDKVPLPLICRILRSV
jgi:hypothetical protein